MGMATFTEDQTQIRKEFLNLKSTFDKINSLSKKNKSLKTTIQTLNKKMKEKENFIEELLKST